MAKQHTTFAFLYESHPLSGGQGNDAVLRQVTVIINDHGSRLALRRRPLRAPQPTKPRIPRTPSLRVPRACAMICIMCTQYSLATWHNMWSADEHVLQFGVKIMLTYDDKLLDVEISL